MYNEVYVGIALHIGESTNTTTLFCIKKRLSNYNPVDFNLIEAKVMDVGSQQKHNKKGPQPLFYHYHTSLLFIKNKAKLSFSTT